MASLIYKVLTPLRWAKRDYQEGDLLELRFRSQARDPMLAGKVAPYGTDLLKAGVTDTRATA